jgi:hypothetical protein
MYSATAQVKVWHIEAESEEDAENMMDAWLDEMDGPESGDFYDYTVTQLLVEEA